jgi:hypothetical protein
MEYKPLDFAAFEIRLLTLRPPSSSTFEPIHCTVTHSSLVSPSPYCALSYCWGDPTNKQEITMNGHPMPVTHNLHVALKQLRSSNIATLWIDALCINQEDVVERGLHVTRMGVIYSKAEEVVV